MKVPTTGERVKRRLATLNEVEFDSHDRATTIGGSEIAAVVGLHPYKTTYQLWLEKRRLFPPEDLSEKDAVHFGQQIEPIIRERWLANNKIDPAGMVCRRSTLIHPLIPWMSYSPDSYHADGTFGLEIKFVGYRMLRGWGIEMTDQIPELYLLQVAWGAVVTRIPVWYIVALVGTELRTYKYVHRPELGRFLLRRARRFMRVHVGMNIPPAPKGNDVGKLKALLPSESDKIRQATPHERALLQRYSEIYPEYKRLEAEVEDLRAEIESHIGPDLGITDGHHTATWKPGKAPGKRSWGWRNEKEQGNE